MEIRIFDTGYFYADGGAMFGAVPKQAWQRRYPCDEENRCRLAMRTVVVRTADRLVVIDTGAGPRHPGELSYYRFTGLVPLEESLQKAGYTPADVTDVVLTHLHFDHCGGCVAGKDSSELVFPNARHWVGQLQWENYRSPHALERSSYYREDMQAVYEAGLLKLVDHDCDLCPGIRLELANGHTPEQLVPVISDGENTLIVAGDVIPLCAHLSLDWISAYDTCALISYHAKKDLLEKAVARQAWVLFCHDAQVVCSKVKKTPDGLFLEDRKARIPNSREPDFIQFFPVRR